MPKSTSPVTSSIQCLGLAEAPPSCPRCPEEFPALKSQLHEFLVGPSNFPEQSGVGRKVPLTAVDTLHSAHAHHSLLSTPCVRAVKRAGRGMLTGRESWFPEPDSQSGRYNLMGAKSGALSPALHS